MQGHGVQNIPEDHQAEFCNKSFLANKLTMFEFFGKNITGKRAISQQDTIICFGKEHRYFKALTKN